MMNKSWPHVGIDSIKEAITAIRKCIEKEEDIEKINVLIEENSKQSKSVNEQALWETYKDFLDPRINDEVRFTEGGDIT